MTFSFTSTSVTNLTTPITLKLDDGIYDMTRQQFHSINSSDLHNPLTLQNTIGYTYDEIQLSSEDITYAKDQTFTFMARLIPNIAQRNDLLYYLSRALIGKGCPSVYLWTGASIASKCILLSMIKFVFGLYCFELDENELDGLFANTKKPTDVAMLTNQTKITSAIKSSRIAILESSRSISLKSNLLKLNSILIVSSIHSPKVLKVNDIETHVLDFDEPFDIEWTPTMKQLEQYNVGLFHILRDYCIDGALGNGQVGTVSSSAYSLTVETTNSLSVYSCIFDAFINTKCRINPLYEIQLSKLRRSYELFCQEINRVPLRTGAFQDMLAVHNVVIQANKADVVYCYGIDLNSVTAKAKTTNASKIPLSKAVINRNWYLKHRDQHLAYMGAKVTCECGKLICRTSMIRHKDSRDHQRWLNQATNQNK